MTLIQGYLLNSVLSCMWRQHGFIPSLQNTMVLRRVQKIGGLFQFQVVVGVQTNKEW